MANPLKAIGKAFVAVGKGLKTVFVAVRNAVQNLERLGLDDELLAIATLYVKEAALIKASSDERRDYVIVRLQEKLPNVPERVLRIAVELGVDAIKQAVVKLDPDPKP